MNEKEFKPKTQVTTESFGTETGMAHYDNARTDKEYAEQKHVFSQKVTMSPAAYIETCAEGFRVNHYSTSYDKLYKNRAVDKERIEELKKIIQTGEMDTPMIEYYYYSTNDRNFTQEGIHRAIAAKELGLKEIPVYIFVSKHEHADETVTDDFLIKELAKLVSKLNKRKSYLHESKLAKLNKQLLEYIGEENRVQVLNQKELINFLNKYRYEYRIVYDELKDWYMIGTAFDHIHEDILYQSAPAYGLSFDGMSDYYNKNYMHLFDLMFTPKEENIKVGFDHNDKAYIFHSFGTVYTKGPDLPKVLLNDLTARYGKAKLIKAVKESEEKFNDNFWNWFGKSKIVDEKGMPKAVSHRSPNKFDTFDKKYIKGNNINGKGFYFSASDDKNKKDSYGKNKGLYYLRMENPVYKSDWVDRATLEKHLDKEVMDYMFSFVKSSAIDKDKLRWGIVFFNLWNYNVEHHTNYDVTELLKSLGYDGIIDDMSDDTLVVFEPEQIKSVDNNGNWSTKTANVFERLNEQLEKYI